MSTLRLRRYRTQLLLAAVAIGALLLVAATQRLDQTYYVYADDGLFEVHGNHETVSDVLDAAGITLDTSDVTVPDLHLQPLDHSAITIFRATELKLTIDDTEKSMSTLHSKLLPVLIDNGVRTSPSDAFASESEDISIESLSTMAVPPTLSVRTMRTITVDDDYGKIVLESSLETVGAVLAEAGITVFSADLVRPAIHNWVPGSGLISIERAAQHSIAADGRTVLTRSHRSDPVEIVAEAGISLAGHDFVRDVSTEDSDSGLQLEVVRVEEAYRTEDSAISYETLVQSSDQLEIDSRGVVEAGVYGTYRKRMLVRYENGVAVSEQLEGEWVAQRPSAEIVGYGTNIVIRTLETPSGPVEYWRKVRMRVTSYTAASSGKPADHPGYGITRSGLPAGFGKVAVDPNVVPFLTNVYVPGYGVGLAADTGGGIKGRWIDLGYDDNAFVAWNGYVDVYYLTPIPPADKINFVIPTWLP